jgi:hypothetical protein
MPDVTGEILSVLFKSINPIIKTVLYTGSSSDLIINNMDCYKFDGMCSKKNGHVKLVDTLKDLQVV